MVSVEASKVCMCVYVELSKEMRNCQQMILLKIPSVSMGGCLQRERPSGAPG